MADKSKVENAKAAREARLGIVSSSQGSSARAVDEAMRLYLVAEEYHGVHQGGAEIDGDKGAAGSESSAGGSARL